jgi:putative peptidoglycan lipid II flippase
MSIFRQLLSVNSIVGVALIFGLINNLAIAAVFGLSRSLDAYFAGVMLPKLFMVLVIDFLGKNFLPIYASRYETSPEEASNLTSIVVTQIGGFAIVVVAILVAVSDAFFTALLPGFGEQDIEIVVGYFAVMAPGIVIMTINAFHTYVWQHSEEYNRVVVARLFIPVTLTVFIFAFGFSFGTGALPYGFLFGQIFTGIFLAWRIPYKYRFRLGLRDKDFVKIVKNSSLLMSTGLIARSRGLIVTYFASQIGEGAISAFTIAQKISQPIYRNALLGIRMILFTRSARAAARENMGALARMHNRALAGVFLLTAPIAVWFLVEAELIVRAVFQRGAFTDTMVADVSAVLFGLAVSIIFLGAVQMASNAFYALDKVSVPAAVMPLGTVIFFVLAAIVTPSFGLLGLSSASSAVSVVVFGILIWKLKQLVDSIDVVGLFLALGRYTVIAAIAAALTHFTTEATNIGVLPSFGLSMILMGASYLVLVWLSGDKLMDDILDWSGLGRWFKHPWRN